ncbi:MAG TPA: hypothetical protein VJ820_07175 [Propionibacteriaceae bacterium]|nr:hypothetical protein [Propionibacteriaceae bacterium]
MLELHHLRKALTRIEAEHPTIDGVYGSSWITSGAGSVVLLNGKPGDAIVSFHHIKQPASEVGPFKIIHDHDTGRSKTWHSVDLVLLAKPGGLTAVAAAMAIFETDQPTANEKDKTRRRLDKVTGHGFLKITRQATQPPTNPRFGRRNDLYGPYARPFGRIAVRTLCGLFAPRSTDLCGLCAARPMRKWGLIKTTLRSPERKTRSTREA